MSNLQRYLDSLSDEELNELLEVTNEAVDYSILKNNPERLQECLRIIQPYLDAVLKDEAIKRGKADREQ